METLLKLEVEVSCIVSAMRKPLYRFSKYPLGFSQQKLKSKITDGFRNAETNIEMYEKLCKLLWTYQSVSAHFR